MAASGRSAVNPAENRASLVLFSEVRSFSETQSKLLMSSSTGISRRDEDTIELLAIEVNVSFSKIAVKGIRSPILS